MTSHFLHVFGVNMYPMEKPATATGTCSLLRNITPLKTTSPIDDPTFTYFFPALPTAHKVGLASTCQGRDSAFHLTPDG